MIARIKTEPTICQFEQPLCKPPATHKRDPAFRKLILPIQRCVNQPFAQDVKPFNREHWPAIVCFEGEPALDDDWESWEELALFLAGFEWEAVSSSYPLRRQEVTYTTAIQFSEVIVAVLAIGSPDYVAGILRGFRGKFFEDCYVTDEMVPCGHAGCVLLNCRWSRAFLDRIQRDAERELVRSLERGQR